MRFRANKSLHIKSKKYFWVAGTGLFVAIFGIATFTLVSSNVGEDQTVSAQGGQVPSSFFHPQLARTGVDRNTGNKEPEGVSDDHWSLHRVYNDHPSRFPHCQLPGYNPASPHHVFNVSATTIVETDTPEGRRAGRSHLGQPTWDFTHNDVRWIGKNHHGTSDGNGLFNPHTASRWCYDQGYTGARPPTSNRQLGPAPGVHDLINDPPPNRWNVFVFRFKDSVDIDPRVDLSTVGMELTGRVDDMAGVTVNGVPLNISCNSGALPPPGNGYGDEFRHSGFGGERPPGPLQNYLPMCGGGSAPGQTTFRTSIRSHPNDNNPFRRTNNIIEIHVKSAYSNAGLILTGARLTGQYRSDAGNARLTVRTEGLSSAQARQLVFSSRHHTVGNCMSNIHDTFQISAGTSVNCTSGYGLGVGPPNGLALYIQSGIPAGYEFLGWTRESAGSCTNPVGANEACVNVPPGSTGNTNTATVTARFGRAPSISIVGTPNCNSFVVNATSPDNNSMDLILIVDGAESSHRRNVVSNGQHNFNSAVASYRDYGTHTFAVRVVDRTTGLTATTPTRTIGPCVDPTCNASNITISPRSPGPGEPFSVTVTFNYSPGENGRIIASAAPHNHVMRVTISGSGHNDVHNNVTHSNNTATLNGLTVGATGVYTVTMRLTGGGIINPINACSVSFTVSEKPYMKVYGGDVIAGSGFELAGGGCTVDGARIRGYAAQNGAQYVGASTQLATMAIGAIQEFSSSAGRTPAPAPPNKLAFSNAPAAGVFGGGLNSVYFPCVGDEFSAAVDSGSEVSSPFGGRNVSDREVFYHDGDLRITGNIAYGPYSSLDNMPSFKLVVKGNIYVSHTVEQLDGIFVAQPRDDGTGGEFVTCVIGATMPNATHFNDHCRRHKLTINGAVIAKKILPYRTRGTLNNAPLNEPAGSNNIAEVIWYTPEAWLVPIAPSSELRYDSITSLPPVL